MSNFDVMFKDTMFVYSAETVRYPSSIKVTVPEVFLDKKTGSAEDIRVAKGNTNIFVNETPPALANSSISKNYLVLPIANSGRVEYIYTGDRLVAQFIGNCPTNGVIIARC